MTQTEMAPALQERTQALQESGWGLPFRLVQPRNLGFWLYVVLVPWGVLATVQLALPGTQIALGSLAVSTVLFAVYALPFIWFLRRMDRFSSIPSRLAIAAFVWGGFVATAVLAVPANDALYDLYVKLLGSDFASNWGHALSAPFSEELAKATGVLVLVLLAPRLISTAFSGLIVGSFIGLGFQIIEDIVYGFRGGSSGFDLDNVQGALSSDVMRTGVGVFSHWLYSGIFCAGLVWFIGRPQQPHRRGLGLALMVVAMLCHGLWHGASGLLSLSLFFLPISYLITPIVMVLTYRWIYRTTVPTQRDWARAILAPEVADGVAAEGEVEAYVGTRKARKVFVRGNRAAKHAVEAVGDLLEAVRRSRGAGSADVDRARAELARVREG